MKLTDVNLLLYALDSAAPRHRAARVAGGAAVGGRDVRLHLVVLLAFLRLSTNPRVFDRPLDPAEAFDVVDGWLAQPCATVVHPTDRHVAVLRELLAPLGTAGNLTTDAHLAALALEHGAELCSSDSDFSRFPGLRRNDPLGP